MAVHIELSSAADNNQERIDYLKMILDKDSKRLELIDSHRHRNLTHALITFATAFGATLKLLPNANPYLVSVALLCLAACFFLRDCQLHKYEHGWNGTIKEHLKKLASVINSPDKSVSFYSYYNDEERHAFQGQEWISFNRWIYYVLILGSLAAGVILAAGWIGST